MSGRNICHDDVTGIYVFRDKVTDMLQLNPPW
ncbi:hypothetical protein CBM2589_A70368 [Cupriavidus taiwanensis]|uniref:Uncharacterized protein n=1 Tax=Cupriavidus taiwanensis TaxID=164546 RepID=A0A375C7Z5_9BURK|nr:hypothetical protein CBM2589_A70368 [Cupriavidus taiwanensis]